MSNEKETLPVAEAPSLVPHKNEAIFHPVHVQTAEDIGTHDKVMARSQAEILSARGPV